jgi:type I restriction enzyme S subunit
LLFYFQDASAIDYQGLTQKTKHSRFLNNFLTPIPPIAEQKQIARFLDRETTRIDTLITKKRQLIDLLQKKRDALVDSLVIKVSDPYEAVKKAGMSWLNDLPDDWENVRLKFLSSFITSGSRGWAEYYSDEGSVFLRIGNLSTESIDLDLTDLQFVQPPKGAEGERTRVYPDDLLISITALIGAVGVVPPTLREAYVNQHTALVRLLNQHVHSRWVAYCVFSSLGQKQLGEFTSGGTKDGLTLSDVGNLLILIPPDEDQELYVKKIDRKIDSIQLTILKTKESIRVLEKYRTALVTAAVTGKIDVREEAN